MASRALLISFGLSSISTPRCPPFTNTVLSLETAALRTTGTRFFCPKGLIPPDVAASQPFGVGGTHHARCFAAKRGSQLFHADCTI